MNWKTYLTLFVVVLAVFVAIKLAGAIVYHLFWPLVLVGLLAMMVFFLRNRNG
jgi:hypothetical protein